MPSKYWIKLYHEVLDDPKMARLPDRLYRRCIEVFLLAGKAGDDGSLPSLDDMAWHLRLDQAELSQDLEALSALGIVTQDERGWFVTNFAKRQDAAPGAERAARYRKTKRQAQYHGNEVRNEQRNESVTKCDVEPDTEIETKTPAIAGGASAQPQEPPKPVKTSTRSDPRSQSPAIQATKRVNNGRYPPQALYGPILDALGDAPDLQRMTECRQAWLSRGYNPNAWTWLLEWYRDGIPKNGRARASPGQSLGDRIDEMVRRRGNNEHETGGPIVEGGIRPVPGEGDG
jgi:hypothetical protein